MLDFSFKMPQNINVIDNNQTSYRVDNHVTSMVLAVRSARSVLAPYYVSCLYGKMLHGKVQQPGVRLYETRHRIERNHYERNIKPSWGIAINTYSNRQWTC